MSTVTVLGLGPMGRAVSRALLAANHRVTVWNRTPARADDLVADGATRADTVAAGLRDADLVIVCLRDDTAVGSVLDDTEFGGTAMVNLTSGSPDGSRRRAEWAASRDIDYLTGAIMTPTPLMGTDQAVVLYSGSADVHERYEATLAAFGGTAAYLGDDAGRASAFDAALLDLFWTATAGIAHALAFAEAERIGWSDLEPFTPAIFAMLPDMMGRFAKELRDGSFPGEVSTVGQADAGIATLVEAGDARGIDTGVLRAAHAMVRRAVQDGYGDDGLGRLAAVLSS